MKAPLIAVGLSLALLGAGCSSSIVTSAGSSNAGFTISSSNPAMTGGGQGISAQGMGLFPTLEVSK